jgi:hypothetical protein
MPYNKDSIRGKCKSPTCTSTLRGKMRNRKLDENGFCSECVNGPRKPSKNPRNQRKCPECKNPRRVLGVNGICKECTESFGLRICVKCKELKLILADFDFSCWCKGEPSYKETCIDCLVNAARASSA